MKITIDYDSCWRNSFLDGSNNKPLPRQKNGFYRKYIGSVDSLKKDGNFKLCEITLDTIMGVLNRLIGDQRKLYQARNKEFESYYYFEGLEDKVTFIDNPEFTYEITYIRNMTGSTDQNSFAGAVKLDDIAFTSRFSKMFWGVLWLDVSELQEFVESDRYQIDKDFECNPFTIIEKLESLKKMKSLPDEGGIQRAKEILNRKFVKMKPLDKKGNVDLQALYCSSLYLQHDRLSNVYDLSSVTAARGGIPGVSHNGFTVKNIMDRFTTGGQKKVFGNPFYRKSRFKGDEPLKMTKASGKLEIIIDVDREKGQEIKRLIENAGVSSFYLGKKGLAYVSNIRV